MQTMTISKDKRYAMKQAQTAYAMAKAFNDLNNQIDLEARQEELNAFDYPIDKEHRRAESLPEICKDPKIDYLIEKSFWDEYFHAVYKRRIAKGWSCNFKLKDAPEYHVSADAESFKLLKMAEDVLIDCVLETIPQTLAKDIERAKTMYKERKELIDIAMRWDTRK